MHYRNGREAKLGDQVVGRAGTEAIAGILVYANPGSTSCNGRVLPINLAQQATYVTLSDLLHVDDALPKSE